jgi:cytochrome P450
MTMMNPSPEGIAAAVVGLTILYLIWRNIRRKLETTKPFGDELPMPTGSHWLFGHLSVFGNDFIKVHQKIFYDEADDHGVCSFWLTGNKGVSVTSFQDARAVLQSTVEHTIVPIMTKHFNNFLGERNIGLMNGKEWKYHRSAILRVFHSQTTLVTSRSAMVNVTQTLVDSLKNQPQPLEIDIEPVMKMITMDVFGRTALSYDFCCCKNLEPSPFSVAFDFLGQDFLRRLRSPFIPTNAFYGIPTATNQRNAQENALIRDFLVALIETRRQEKPQNRSPDLLTSLLKAHDDLKEQAVEEMTDQIMVDNMMALLFAGFDTTSITLMYALYLVATNPEVEQQCLREIGGIWEQDGNLTDPDRLVYCGGVISETLRMYPPAFVVNRKVTKAIELSNGFVLPEGTMVLIPIFMIQHDPKHFERPEECLVERWIKRDGAGSAWVVRDANDTSSSDVPPGNRNAIFAFSGGARSCAAQKFAIQEATLVLANLLKDLKFTVKPGYVPYPQRNGIVQSPGGMPMTITVR